MIRIAAFVDAKADGHSVSIHDGAITFSKDEHSFTVDPALVVHKPDICVLYRTEFDGYQLVWDSELQATRESAASLIDAKGIDFSKPLAMFGFASDGTYVFAQQALKALHPGDADVVAIDMESSKNRSWIAAQNETINAFHQKNLAKRALLRHVKLGDSVAALEYQVDLLSKLVFVLLSESGITVRDDWFSRFETVVNQHSVANLKTIDEMLDGIANQKSAIRDLQVTYLSNINKAV